MTSLAGPLLRSPSTRPPSPRAGLHARARTLWSPRWRRLIGHATASVAGGVRSKAQRLGNSPLAEEGGWGPRASGSSWAQSGTQSVHTKRVLCRVILRMPLLL